MPLGGLVCSGPKDEGCWWEFLNLWAAVGGVDTRWWQVNWPADGYSRMGVSGLGSWAAVASRERGGSS